MTTTTKKTIVLISILIAAIILFWKKAKASANSILKESGGTGTSAPETPLLYINTNSDFSVNTFYFLTPAGSFTIANPDTSNPAYNLVHSDSQFQFGWQAPHPGEILVTLMPMEKHPLVENVILNLTTQSTEFKYVQL
jgi:hypothetical protein